MGAGRAGPWRRFPGVLPDPLIYRLESITSWRYTALEMCRLSAAGLPSSISFGDFPIEKASPVGLVADLSDSDHMNGVLVHSLSRSPARTLPDFTRHNDCGFDDADWPLAARGTHNRAQCASTRTADIDL